MSLDLEGGWHWLADHGGYLALGEDSHQLHMQFDEGSDTLEFGRGAFVSFTADKVFIEPHSDIFQSHATLFFATKTKTKYRLKKVSSYTMTGDCWRTWNTKTEGNCNYDKDACNLEVISAGKCYNHVGECGNNDSGYKEEDGWLTVTQMPKSEC